MCSFVKCKGDLCVVCAAPERHFPQNNCPETLWPVHRECQCSPLASRAWPGNRLLHNPGTRLPTSPSVNVGRPGDGSGGGWRKYEGWLERGRCTLSISGLLALI